MNSKDARWEWEVDSSEPGPGNTGILPVTDQSSRGDIEETEQQVPLFVVYLIISKSPEKRQDKNTNEEIREKSLAKALAS